MKKWYESKTIWIAILQLIGGLTVVAVGVLQGQTALDVPGLLIIGKSIIDLVVRFKTDSGIE